MIAPPSWKSLTEGAACEIEWPDQRALLGPPKAHPTYWREAKIKSIRSKSAMIELDSGAVVEVLNLKALRIDGTPKDKTNKNDRRGA